jgi:hypothetical protein
LLVFITPVMLTQLAHPPHLLRCSRRHMLLGETPEGTTTHAADAKAEAILAAARRSCA